jgi:hypothetical protein
MTKQGKSRPGPASEASANKKVLMGQRAGAKAVVVAVMQLTSGQR